jgi:signal-transduction protein with cAMP-binding, CBS, and nucleotidyltransferase domain
LTNRDIVTRTVAERRDPQTVKVDEIASRELVTVEPEQDLDEALALMARHQVRRLPVVEQGQLVGMLAQADVALEAKEKKVGEKVEQISQPTSIEREWRISTCQVCGNEYDKTFETAATARRTSSTASSARSTRSRSSANTVAAG